MKILEPSVVKIPQPKTLTEALQLAEMAGRVSHRSEDKITDTSYEGFIKNMLKMKHLSVLEFAPMYLEINMYEDEITEEEKDFVVLASKARVPYLKSRSFHNGEATKVYISTNYRVLVERNVEDLKRFWVEPGKYHFLRHTFRCDTAISVTREANRHRSLSVIEESTRYVCYAKDKFGNEIRILKPKRWDSYTEKQREIFVESWLDAERHYLELINEGVQAQDAREVLPLATYSRVYYAGFTSDWDHFFELRDSTAAHPNIRVIAQSIKMRMYNN